MSEEKIITEKDLHNEGMLAMPVIKDTEVKKFLVEYTGDKFNNEEVTVHMIAEMLAVEFPEFVYGFAEENFLRGYKTGLDDAEGLLKTTTTDAV
jgi:hypothetical protein|tara:strand:+ start:565 stop:846 length:282 start_codon:yes stop_codon:yes gene_type:complete